MIIGNRFFSGIHTKDGTKVPYNGYRRSKQQESEGRDSSYD